MIIDENGKKYTVSLKENGDKFWYLNNKLHREEGPAIELVNGGQAWYLEGVKFSDGNAFQKKLKFIKTATIKEKHYYDVKIECMLPATITYRILAETPQQAAELIKNQSPIGVKHRLIGKKDLKLSVYNSGSNMLLWMKNLLGI